MESRIPCFLCRAEDLECIVSILRVVTCAHCRYMHVLKTDYHCYSKILSTGGHLAAPAQEGRGK